MERYYYFYDLNEILIDRYPAQIATHIFSETKKNNFIFIYSEKYADSNPINIPEGSKYFFLPSLSKKSLIQIISKYPPISLTTIAQRIPDMWMITLFNHLGYPTFVVQHGLWSDKLERIPLVPLLFGKFVKFVHYIKHVQSISKLNNLSQRRTLYELYRFLLKEDINISDTSQLHNDMIRARKVFVFDKSWDDYYLKKYGYQADNLIYIGNPDFLLLKDKNLNNKEDAVCYLCQSLVEDGRFIYSEYQKFLKLLKGKVVPFKKLYIKLHPRSRVSYYEILKDVPNVIFTKELPICQYYIGHYTGLLATVAQVSDNILIWKFPDHHIPEYFLTFGSIISSDQRDLTNFVIGKYKKRAKLNQNRLSTQELNSFNPIKKISNTLINIVDGK